MSVSQLLSQNKANCSLSAFDKENLIESSLDLLHYIYNYYHSYVSYLLQSSCPSADFFVTYCDYDLWLHVWHNHFCDLYHIFLWLCDYHMIFLMLHLSNNLKEKKRNINIDLVILPSYDITLLLSFLVLRNFPIICSMGQLCCLFHCYLLPFILLLLNFPSLYFFPLLLLFLGFFFFVVILLSQMVTYLVCDELKYGFKSAYKQS